MEMMNSVIVTLVLKMKETAIIIITVKMVLFVDQIIVHLLTLTLIVVTNLVLEMKITVHLEYFVEKMKGIVILTVNVKATTFVDQTTARIHLALTMKLTVVVVLIL